MLVGCHNVVSKLVYLCRILTDYCSLFAVVYICLCRFSVFENFFFLFSSFRNSYFAGPVTLNVVSKTNVRYYHLSFLIIVWFVGWEI